MAFAKPPEIWRKKFVAIATMFFFFFFEAVLAFKQQCWPCGYCVRHLKLFIYLEKFVLIVLYCISVELRTRLCLKKLPQLAMHFFTLWWARFVVNCPQIPESTHQQSLTWVRSFFFIWRIHHFGCNELWNTIADDHWTFSWEIFSSPAFPKKHQVKP